MSLEALSLHMILTAVMILAGVILGGYAILIGKDAYNYRLSYVGAWCAAIATVMIGSYALEGNNTIYYITTIALFLISAFAFRSASLARAARNTEDRRRSESS